MVNPCTASSRLNWRSSSQRSPPSASAGRWSGSSRNSVFIVSVRLPDLPQGYRIEKRSQRSLPSASAGRRSGGSRNSVFIVSVRLPDLPQGYRIEKRSQRSPPSASAGRRSGGSQNSVFIVSVRLPGQPRANQRASEARSEGWPSQNPKCETRNKRMHTPAFSSSIAAKANRWFRPFRPLPLFFAGADSLPFALVKQPD